MTPHRAACLAAGVFIASVSPAAGQLAAGEAPFAFVVRFDAPEPAWRLSAALAEVHFTPVPPRWDQPAPAAPQPVQASHVDWRGVTLDSLRFLALQQGARVVIREHVREGLKGPFFEDYWNTLATPPDSFWDGDPWFTNFVGHAVQGAATYRLARVNGATRAQAFWWGVAYSTQFELGLLGEAAIGNIPISPIDLVYTPIGGFALGVAEEWLRERLPRRGERYWLLTRPLLMGHVIAWLLTRK